MRKILPSITLLLLPLITTAQYTDQINTNRPGQSMAAFAVGKTIFQVETGLNGRYEKHNILNYESYGGSADFTVRYGAFWEELEFIANFNYQIDQYNDALYTYSRDGFRQSVIGAKYLVYDPDKYYEPEVNLYSWKANHKFKWHSLIPAVGVYAGANIIGDNNPYTFPGDGISPKFMAITQNHFGKWVWVNNFIYDKLGTDYPSMGWITTLTRGFNETWSGFLEFQGFSSDYYADGIARIGAAHLIGDNIQLDASLSANFKSTPSIYYGGIGFSWRFNGRYNDILLPGSKGDREEMLKEDQEKEKKKREKLKKEREARKALQFDEDAGR